MVLRLTHETGVATLLQFIVLGLLNIIGTVNSTVAACRDGGGGCLVEIFVSSILFLLMMSYFAFVCLLGYMAQERRSRRFSQLLIGAESLIALVALASLKFPTDALGQITSLVALVSALWIIMMAYRVMKSGGKRITRLDASRPRRRLGS